MTLALSVVVCTHNPHRGRLTRTLAGLRAQTLPLSNWELFIVDNRSEPALDAATLSLDWHPTARVLREPTLGLSHARAAGFAASAAEIVVLVDDDNVLAPDYLARCLTVFAEDAKLGVIGGKSLPEFEHAPAPWMREFDGLLALRDLGDAPIATYADAAPLAYPAHAPMGAGMALRRAAAQAWLAAFRDPARVRLSDRRGHALTSAGDNDIVMCALRAGHGVAYVPGLQLLHLIPAGRLTRDYLARLNEGIQTSWMQLLRLHGINPWPTLSALGARLRQFKAWWTYSPWRSDAHFVRWRGALGHFAGRRADDGD